MRHEATKKREPVLGVIGRVRTVTSLREVDEALLVQILDRYLADRSPKVRTAALDVVREKNLHDLNERVLNLLCDKNEIVRYTAVECLGSLHEGESGRASWLYPLLQDSSHLVRIETLESMALIGDRESLPLISERLRDDDALVRAYAARSIAQLGGKEYVPAIRRALEVEKNDSARVGFADALFSLGDTDQFSNLLDFLSSADYHLRCASANALGAAELTSSQLQSALAAVTHAARAALVVADKSTMERVEKELREQL
jgi:HEAT repeat protein